MTKTIKKIIAVIMSLTLFMSNLVLTSEALYAQTLDDKVEQKSNDEIPANKISTNEIEEDFTYINPLYKGLDIKTYSEEASTKDLAKTRTLSETKTTSIQEFNTLEDGAEYLKQEMIKRSGMITFKLNNVNSEDLGKKLFDKAVEDNGYGPSSEGDYLISNWFAYRIGASSEGDSTTITYEMYYLSTYEQELEVEKEVKRVLDELDVYNEDDYTKVKAVHDYVVANIDYDFNYNNYSPYNAIIDKNVVCQGFSGITCKLLKELNVGVRFILGNEGTHAWNIVKLGSYWYNIDNTWDACNRCYYGNIDYTYFLKGSSNFYDHTRNAEYDTVEFNTNFPTDTNSYVYQPIQKKSISSASIEVNDQTYTGEKIEPSIKVILDNIVLKENVDYEVSYTNNINIGKASVIITGIGDYTGSKTADFNIIAVENNLPENSTQEPENNQAPENSTGVSDSNQVPENSIEVPENNKEPESSTEAPENNKEPEDSTEAPAPEKENNPPVIEASDLVFNIGDKVDLLKNIKATDKEDGNITSKVKVKKSNLNINKSGKYYVIYEVTDSDGNTTTVNRKITVLNKFNKFTVNKVKTTSTYISGYGEKGSKVKAYVNGKQIGKTVTTSSKTGYYKINIPKQKALTKITLKISKSGYTTKEISTLVYKVFSKFTVNKVKTTSKYISGYSEKGSKVKAYVNGKQIGKTVTASTKNGYYKINISKQKRYSKIIIKISKSGYYSTEKSITVK